MSVDTFNAETIAMAAGVLLSLAFSYIPGLQTWYEALTGTEKRLLMLGLLVLVSGGVFGLACLDWSKFFGLPTGNPPMTCDAPGAGVLIRALILAVIANQAAYQISPKVVQERALRKVS
jgi:hypothetical protein